MKLNYPKSKTIKDAEYIGNWGNTQSPVYVIKTSAALNQLIGYAKWLNRSNGTVLYRGQPEDYNTMIPSACRTDANPVDISVIENIGKDERLINSLKLSDSEIAG